MTTNTLWFKLGNQMRAGYLSDVHNDAEIYHFLHIVNSSLSVL